MVYLKLPIFCPSFFHQINYFTVNILLLLLCIIYKSNFMCTSLYYLLLNINIFGKTSTTNSCFKNGNKMAVNSKLNF